MAIQPRTSDCLISHWRAFCLLAHDNWRCSIKPEIFTHQNLPEPGFDLGSTVGESSVLTATLHMLYTFTFCIFFRLNISKESLFGSCNPLSQKKSLLITHSCMVHTRHSRNIMENNPVYQNCDGSLEKGIKLVFNGERTLSDVAPTLITLLQNGVKWVHAHLMMPGRLTPYHVICRGTGDHQELLELMIKEIGRSLLNTKDGFMCTALMYAVRHANIKCVESLIAYGADVNVSMGSLNHSIKLLHPKFPLSYNTMMDIFDLLLDSGADVNKPCPLSRTPIMYAASVGNVNCVKKLILKGAQFNHTDREGHTVWTLAARAGSVDVLKRLIEDNDIDKNFPDKNGFSILYWAVHSGNIEVVRYLLKQGIIATSFVPQEHVEPCNKCGTNISCHYIDAKQLYTDPYIKAISFNKPNVVRLLDEYGFELGKYPEILSHAIRKKSVNVVEYLLCNYKYPLNYGYIEKHTNSKMNSGHQTFLIKACKTQSVEIVKLLLKHGANPNIECCAEKCASAINVVICGGQVELLPWFIRGGAQLNTASYFPFRGVLLPFEASMLDRHIYAAEMLLVSGCSRGVYSWNRTLNANLRRKMLELLKEWNVHQNNVLPLKQRCRMVILNHLCPQADKKIKELPLPPQIIKYLSIPELDDIVQKHLSANR